MMFRIRSLNFSFDLSFQFLTTLLSPLLFLPFVAYALAKLTIRTCRQRRAPDAGETRSVNRFKRCVTQVWRKVFRFPPTSSVKLDQETIDILTAAINTACARQFERYVQTGTMPPPETVPAFVPPPSTSSATVTIEKGVQASKGGRPKSSSQPPIKKVRANDQREVHIPMSDESSAGSVNDLQERVYDSVSGMNKEGVILEP
jgi:hypothetical protein